MSTRFLPTREPDLDGWLANFSGLITAAPATYGLSVGDASTIKTAVDAWRAAFEAALAPITRTRGTVQTKREHKRAVVGVARAFAARIRVDAAVSDELKLGLGLKLRPRRGTPVPVPALAPALVVRDFRPGLHGLQAVGAGPSARVAGLMVYRAVGMTPISDPTQAPFLTLSTRTRFASTFTQSDHGKTATYFARWVNSKGEVGPWSTALISPIAA